MEKKSEKTGKKFGGGIKNYYLCTHDCPMV